jgi:hypothetical protein
MLRAHRHPSSALALALHARPLGLLAATLLAASAGCIGGADSDPADPDTQNESSPLSAQHLTVNLRTYSGNYLVADHGGGAALAATSKAAKGWETFTLSDLDGGSLLSGDLVTLKGSSGQWVSAKNGGGSSLSVTAPASMGWEEFQIVKLDGGGAIVSGDTIALKTHVSGQFVSAINAGGGAVAATAPTAREWETLTLLVPGAGSGPKAGFTHPGVMVNRDQLDFVKGKVAAGASPWKGAFDKAKSSDHASLSYKPSPHATVECGPYSKPDIGCSDEKNDAIAAYTQALLWYLTGNEAYAKSSIHIMNAWSSTLQHHTNSNAPLQSAWVGSVFPRAAELIRHTYTGWAAADVARFEALLRNVYLPEVINGSSSNGNWELSMIEAAIDIGVFLDDQATFDKAVAMWKKRVPAYVYLKTDGALPVPPPSGNKSSSQALIDYWYHQSTFVDGLAQETCRDLGHVQYGLAAMTNAAETALIQGVDLYATEAKRITAAYEFHAQYLDGKAVPGWLCGGSLNAKSPDPMWEVGYNEYAGREGLSLPNTKALLGKIRPTGADHHMVWETLTHAGVGSVGID